MVSTFSIAESVRFGWETLKAHSALVYQVLFTVLGMQVAYEIVVKVLGHTLLGSLAAVVLLAGEVVFIIGATRISLKLGRGEHASYEEIVPPVKIVLRYIGANILAALIIMLPVIVGVLLTSLDFALVPSPAAAVVAILVSLVAFAGAVYFCLRYIMVRFAIFDRAGVTQSLRTSAEITAGEKWHLLVFLLAIIGLNILGALALLVGLLVSIPLTMIAFAHVYHKLSAK